LEDNGVDGLVYIINHQPEAIITNVDLNALSGIELYRLVKAKVLLTENFISSAIKMKMMNSIAIMSVINLFGENSF